MDLSVVIVNCNTKGLLKKCLLSVLENVGKLEFEIFAIDNGSHDGSQEMIKKDFPLVKLIENNANLGFPKANNQGMRIAIGEYVLLLNPDTVMLSNSLNLLMTYIKNNPQVGAVAPRLVNADGSPQMSVSNFPDLFTVFARYVVPRFLSTKIKKFLAKSALKKFFGNQVESYFSYRHIDIAAEVDNISGACLLIKRKTVEEVGVLDDRIFLYSEDMDWCYRARKKGWKIVYFPEARVIHYGGQTTGGDFRPIPFCYGIESEYYFFKKHYSKIRVFLAKFLLLSALLMRAPWFFYQRLLLKKRNNNPNLMSIYLSVTKKVISGKPYG